MSDREPSPIRRQLTSGKQGTNGTSMTFAEVAPVLLGEARRKPLELSLIFAFIAIATLLLGLLLPKSYSASTTILAQDTDIIQPLLEGRAVATGVADRAGIARQVLFSRKVMQDILKTGGWMEDSPGAVQQDRVVEKVQDRIKITSPRPNLVQIDYTDSDPERAFHVTQRLAELLISETLAGKERESRDAYQFIDSQVQGYYRKLNDAELKLQDYRSRNPDAQPGDVADATSRMSTLRTQLEQSRLDLLEQQSRVSSLSSQLSGESAVTAVQTRTSLYAAQMASLQQQLSTLLLTYTEEYPDVVRIRHQIADIQSAMQQEQDRQAKNGGGGALGPDAQLNPLYQDLKSKLADARRDEAAGQARVALSTSMLNDELDRSRRIASSESTVAELTRDYEVNRDIYQDLLKRRENARVSMELDKEKRGLTMRVQDPAVMPVRPSGLRFRHIALAGFALALAIPFGLLYTRARFDPRIRSATQLRNVGEYPLLAAIPTYLTQTDRRRNQLRTISSIAVCALVLLCYGAVFAYKQLHA